MPPFYPHLPDPSQPAPAKVRARRVGGRLLASAWDVLPIRGSANNTRVLLIRPDHLGDLLFLGPALRHLRSQTDAYLTLAVGPWARPALPALAECYDDLLELPFPAFERRTPAGMAKRWSLLPQTAHKLRKESFDSAIIFRPDHWWGTMLAAFAGIPTRIGFDTPETSPWLSQALALPYEHTAASNLRLVSAFLGNDEPANPLHHPLDFVLNPDDIAEAEQLLSALAVEPDKKLVVIHPGAGAAIKLWDSGKWGEVAQRLAAAGCVVLLTGGPNEKRLSAEVAAAAHDAAIDLGGKTSFGVLAALLHTAVLVLGPDSGPLNLAVAVGTSTVHLYGPADSVLFGPWGDAEKHVVLRSAWGCVPCGRFDWPDLPEHGCVRDIAVDAVFDTAHRLLLNQTI